MFLYQPSDSIFLHSLGINCKQLQCACERSFAIRRTQSLFSRAAADESDDPHSFSALSPPRTIFSRRFVSLRRRRRARFLIPRATINAERRESHAKSALEFQINSFAYYMETVGVCALYTLLVSCWAVWKGERRRSFATLGNRHPNVSCCDYFKFYLDCVENLTVG